MDLLVQYDLAKQLKVDLNNLYVNDRGNPSICKMKQINDTYGLFHIPFDKCLTTEIVQLIIHVGSM